MAVRNIIKLSVDCDTCGKTVLTGKTSVQLLQAFQEEASYTEMFCTDCVKIKSETPELLTK